MTQILDDNGWASQEFSRAQLGDPRLTQRLQRLCAQAARTPAGAITAVFRDAAQREAAFRFIENDRFSFQDVATAAQQACALRCSAFPYVFVPTDGSSLLLSDPDGSKGLGGVGPWNKGGRGLQTMTAIALSPDGVPLGILGQTLWARLVRSPSGKKDPRPPHQRESQVWLDVMHEAQQILCEQAPDAVPWFQLCRRRSETAAGRRKTRRNGVESAAQEHGFSPQQILVGSTSSGLQPGNYRPAQVGRPPVHGSCWIVFAVDIAPYADASRLRFFRLCLVTCSVLSDVIPSPVRFSVDSSRSPVLCHFP